MPGVRRHRARREIQRMKTTAWRIVSTLALVCMAAMAVLAFALGPCTGVIETAEGSTVPMKCHWTYLVIEIFGIAGMLMAILAVISKTKEGRRFTATAVLVMFAAILFALSPAGIGTCAAAGMKCIVDSYILWAAGIIGAILSVAMIVKSDPQQAELPKMSL